MSTLGALVAQGLHLALMLAAAPVAAGLVGWFGARLEGRHGASPWQPWRDLRALLRKRPVLAENASPVSGAAPLVAVAALAVALAGVPSFARGLPFATELVLVAGLLALARAAAVLAAMDAGTATGGLAAARGNALGVWTMPALLLAGLGLAVPAGGTNLDAVVAAAGEGGAGLRLPWLFAALALAAVAAADTAGPDAPPEASGRHLALWRYAAALRLTLWLTLLAALLPPYAALPAERGVVAWVVGLLAWGAKLGGLCLALAVFRHGAAPARAGGVSAAAGAATLLAALAVALLLVGTGPT